MGLPDAFLEKMKDVLGEDYEAWQKSFASKSFRGLRVNTSKVDVEEFVRISPFPLRRIPWISNGFYLGEEAEASRHPYYAAGLYYLQEPSAMTPAEYLPVEEGDRVLDLCAAPGGKATRLSDKLRGTGLLAANDISNSRAKALLKNLELFGAGNILVTSETPERLAAYFEGYFDKILIDAPCSGEGMFRKDPSMVKDWTERGPDYYAQIQKGLVEQAARLLRPGGMLLYSTCTFSPEENEGTIAHLLKTDPSFHVVPLPAYEGFSEGRPDLISNGRPEGPELDEDLAGQLRGCVRIYPHRMDGEGHFAALLQKDGESRPEDRKKASAAVRTQSPEERKSLEEWKKFAGLFSISMDESRLRLYDKKLYYLPKALAGHNIRGLRFLRTGLLLGEVEKKRFEPSQALAMYLRKTDETPALDFPAGDGRVIRYLKGETLDVDDLLTGAEDSGWRLICVDGFPLGWGKLINGQLRNKYYAGWRW